MSMMVKLRRYPPPQMGKNAKIETYHFIALMGPYIIELYENHQKQTYFWLLGC